MDRQPVDSSTLVSVGYDENIMTLEVEFTGGRIYSYFNVPTFEFERLMAAASPGKYFNANIRNAYACERA